MDIHIGFLDSGVGGLSYYHALYSQIIDSSQSVSSTRRNNSSVDSLYMHYFADNIYFPYGEKSESFIIERVSEVLPQLVKQFNVSIMVIACNTISLIALDHIRKLLSIPVVGVVPALKPAIQGDFSHIYVMNTDASSQSEYAKNLSAVLTKEFGSNPQIFLRACQPLVSAIEYMLLEEGNSYHAYTIAELSKIVEEIYELSCQAVVLGCTHFLHVKKELRTLLNNDIHIIDSLEGVVNRIVQVLEECVSTQGLVVDSSIKVVRDLYCTNQDSVEKYNGLKNRYSLNKIEYLEP